MLFIYTLPLNLLEGSKFIILYIKQNFGMSATRLCKYLIYFCIFKETVAVLYGNTYYETPCIMQTCPCDVDPLTTPFSIVKLGFTGVFIFSYFCLTEAVLTCTTIYVLSKNMKTIKTFN